MTSMKRSAAALKVSNDFRGVRRLLNNSEVRVFLPSKTAVGGVFRRHDGSLELVQKLPRAQIELWQSKGVLVIVRTSKSGVLYRVAFSKERAVRPRTAQDHRAAAWKAAEQAFAENPNKKDAPVLTVGAESPIGWLARRRDANGKPFLNHDEVAAAERLRIDFEKSQLAPGVTQDWKRFLTSGVEGGTRGSVQERNVDDGASAARQRLSNALDALGNGLSDVALRVCCFLEGIEAIETSMHWSRRSGKVVLKIALQRLADHYERISVRKDAAIEAWQSDVGA